MKKASKLEYIEFQYFTKKIFINEIYEKIIKNQNDLESRKQLDQILCDFSYPKIEVIRTIYNIIYLNKINQTLLATKHKICYNKLCQYLAGDHFFKKSGWHDIEKDLCKIILIENESLLKLNIISQSLIDMHLQNIIKINFSL